MANKKKRVNSRRRVGMSYGPLQSLAYKLGQIERGRNNPNSLISESFEAGKRKPQKREKKPLF